MIRQNFNADWTVEKGDGNSRMNSFLGNTQTKTVHLPYDAMIHEARTPDTKNGAQTGFYPGGEYIFQKHFTAPQAWQGKPVSLGFEGVYQTALVYLNGWLLTRNVNAYCNLVPICEWTREAAETYAEMRVELEKHGTPVGSMDMLIAASAIAEGAILVTNNIAHFSKIGKLRVENWSVS